MYVTGRASGSGVHKTGPSVIILAGTSISVHIHSTSQDVDLRYAAWKALETILAPLNGGSMHDPANELRRIPLPRTPVNKGIRKRVGLFPTWHDRTRSFARCSGCSLGLRRGRGGSAHCSARRGGSAHCSARFGGGRALKGCCWPRSLGRRPLFRSRSLRTFEGRRRRNRTLGRQEGWRLGRVVAEVEEYGYNQRDKCSKYSDRSVEDIEEPIHSHFSNKALASPSLRSL